MAVSDKKGRELLKRSVSGIILVSIIVMAVDYGGLVWSVLATIFGMVSLLEFYRISSKRLKLSKGIGLLAGMFFMSFVGFLGAQEKNILAGLALVFFVTLFVELIRRQSVGFSTAIENGAGVVAGLVYIILPWCFSIYLRNSPIGKIVLLSVFFCTWSCDVFAYLVGSRWGKHRLCDQVSPKKTWEGFYSGVAGSFLAAAVVAYVREFPPFPILVIGLVCGVAGQLGDLAESIFKREVGVKDSGNILPGHGGMLDRFDSVLVSLTIIYFIFEVLWR
ncbi:phosphatidate cytidylyltransferase [Dethiosulfovibrio salsuginis]|uniref:Phosphatidate cytidylyltransferase n=1 Tax=Dethiosulfovibrio salsuginis TaxID=561720 RepID=A0A1X7I473_9BACT|nr:phosphatidate cytidylyltransferase [Dethiosulfovibrio salsuginis]SMG08984.1 phosphatidate cytidylyltransferase [Dethiosulfovibrio salsuginis]